MKKNLICILILALLIVNLVLTAIMMFSVVSANQKTAAVVGDIASVLQLEIEGSSPDGSVEQTEVSIEDTEVHDIEDKLTILMKKGEDGKDHYAVVSVSLAMNTKDEDYETYGGESLASKESLIKGEIIEAFSSYTMDEAKADPEMLQADILNRIQTMFDSKFIYKVSFSNILYQ